MAAGMRPPAVDRAAPKGTKKKAGATGTRRQHEPITPMQRPMLLRRRMTMTMTTLASLMKPLDLNKFPWMRFAYQELGQKEVLGPTNNRRIVEYQRAAGNPADEEVAWCSAFANWCMLHGRQHGTGLPNARSWLAWGDALPLRQPIVGCVTVLTRTRALDCSDFDGQGISAAMRAWEPHDGCAYGWSSMCARSGSSAGRLLWARAARGKRRGAA
jgi:uncharacterized protein (TIGR02594 family)